MSYSDFTLRKVKQDFDLIIQEEPIFLHNYESISPSPFLATFLENNLPWLCP